MSSTNRPRRQPTRGKNASSTEATDQTETGVAPQSTSTDHADEDGEPMQGVEHAIQADPESSSSHVSTGILSAEKTGSKNNAVRPTPAESTRPAPQRLASLHSRPGANAVPSDRRPQPLKFKPKSFIRRSAAEREAVERAEAERRNERQVADGRGNRRGRGGPDGRGRGGLLGRGAGQAGRPGMDRSQPMRNASGVFGGAEIRERVRGSRVRRADGEDDVGPGAAAGESSGRADAPHSTSGAATVERGQEVKSEAGVKPDPSTASGKKSTSSKAASKPKTLRKTKVKKEDEMPEYISDEADFESDPGEKVNIEFINIVSSEEENGSEDESEVAGTNPGKRREDTAGALKSKGKWMVLPVRMDRQEHVERAVGVNTEASSLPAAALRRRAKEREAADEDRPHEVEKKDIELVNSTSVRARRKPKDVEFVRDERKWKGVWDVHDESQAVDGVNIKTEPEDEGGLPSTARSMNELRDESRCSPTRHQDSDEAVPDDSAADSSNRIGLQIPDHVRKVLQENGMDTDLDGKLARGELPTVPGYSWKKDSRYSDLASIDYVHGIEGDDDSRLAERIPWTALKHLPAGYEWQCETQSISQDDANITHPRSIIASRTDLPVLPPDFEWNIVVDPENLETDELCGWAPTSEGFTTSSMDIDGIDNDEEAMTIKTALAELEALQSIYHAMAASKKSAPSSGKSKVSKSNIMLAQHSYLVQLPPLVPSLRDILTKPRSPKLERRPKPEPAVVPTNPFNVHPKDAAKVNADEERDPHGTGMLEPTPRNAYIQNPSGFSMTPGHVGTLTFCEDGQTYATWGFGPEEVRFQISLGGNEGDLSQEVLVTQYERTMAKVEDQAKWEEIVKVGGENREGLAVGRVNAGFVGVPDWGGLL